MKQKLVYEITTPLPGTTWINFYKESKDTPHKEWIDSLNYGWFK